jgi:hypothetical protein
VGAVEKVEETKGEASKVPTWVGELTRTQAREIKACLLFLFKPLEDGSGWARHAEQANMTASVTYGEERNSLLISVIDDDAGFEVELWRTELRLTGQWVRRLRQASGEALVLGQSRPRCPRCGKPLRLRRRKEGDGQFFGCTMFRRCHGSVNIVDHDFERAS